MVQGDQSMRQGIKLGGRVECLRNLGGGVQAAKEQLARSRWTGEEGLASRRSKLVRHYAEDKRTSLGLAEGLST